MEKNKKIKLKTLIYYNIFGKPYIEDGSLSRFDMATVSNTQSNYLKNKQNTSYCAYISKNVTGSIFSANIHEFVPIVENSEISWVDCFADDFDGSALTVALMFGFSDSLVTELLSNKIGGYEDFGTEMGLLLPKFRVHDLELSLNPLLILIKDKLILSIHNHETRRFNNLRRYAESYLSRLTKNYQKEEWLSLTLLRIIDENNTKNFERLQDIEEGSDDLTCDLKGDTVDSKHITDQIYQMKQTMLKYDSGLWATIDVLAELRSGDAELVTDSPQILEKIGYSIDDINRQLGLAEHLTEVLASSMECIQSINNNLLQEKNNLLQDKNNKLQGMNNLLQKRNNELQEYSNQLQEYNNKLQEKNNQLQEVNNTISEKNNSISEYNNLISEKNNVLTAANNRLTKLAAFLAIIATGFVVPNTIATVLSQTNIFSFNTNDAPFYILLILGTTIGGTILTYLWSKRTGLLVTADNGTNNKNNH
ncbi:hypothetical protein FJY84_01885 [Candidatus Bathyarchaeota archaeon]|nr:hypothetical protein [Candidatus Bathyarchaeota archaeon]